MARNSRVLRGIMDNALAPIPSLTPPPRLHVHHEGEGTLGSHGSAAPSLGRVGLINAWLEVNGFSMHLRPPGSPDLLFYEFHQAQRRVLEQFGAASAAPSELPDARRVALIYLEDEHGERVAGVRIHLRSAGAPLPLEAIAERYEIDIPLELGLLGEVSGLWAGPSARGRQTGAMLVAACVAWAPSLGAEVLYSFVHQHNGFTEAVGFARLPELPSLAYPDERYISCFHRCDPGMLAGASETWREGITALRHTLARLNPTNAAGNNVVVGAIQ